MAFRDDLSILRKHIPCISFHTAHDLELYPVFQFEEQFEYMMINYFW